MNNCGSQLRPPYLVDVVQLGTRPAAVVRLLPEPLGANFDPAAAGLAAAGPVGPFAEFTVRGTGDDARLLDVTWREDTRKKGYLQSQDGIGRGTTHPSTMCLWVKRIRLHQSTLFI